jgi:hypothetical protein
LSYGHLLKPNIECQNIDDVVARVFIMSIFCSFRVSSDTILYHLMSYIREFQLFK